MTAEFSTGLIVGFSVGVVIAILVVAGLAWWSWRRAHRRVRRGRLLWERGLLRVRAVVTRSGLDDASSGCVSRSRTTSRRRSGCSHTGRPQTARRACSAMCCHDWSTSRPGCMSNYGCGRLNPIPLSCAKHCLNCGSALRPSFRTLSPRARPASHRRSRPADPRNRRRRPPRPGSGRNRNPTTAAPALAAELAPAPPMIGRGRSGGSGVALCAGRYRQDALLVDRGYRTARSRQGSIDNGG